MDPFGHVPGQGNRGAAEKAAAAGLEDARPRATSRQEGGQRGTQASDSSVGSGGEVAKVAGLVRRMWFGVFSWGLGYGVIFGWNGSA